MLLCWYAYATVSRVPKTSKKSIAPRSEIVVILMVIIVHSSRWWPLIVLVIHHEPVSIIVRAPSLLPRRAFRPSRPLDILVFFAVSVEVVVLGSVAVAITISRTDVNERRAACCAMTRRFWRYGRSARERPSRGDLNGAYLCFLGCRSRTSSHASTQLSISTTTHTRKPTHSRRPPPPKDLPGQFRMQLRSLLIGAVYFCAQFLHCRCPNIACRSLPFSVS